MASAHGGVAGGSEAPPGERRQLLQRVREQEGVIQRLWERYTRDVGREPEVGDIASVGRQRYVPARTEVLRKVLEKEPTFEDAVDAFDLECAHVHAEAPTQRANSQLLHSRRPTVVARRSGDVVLRGFWGRGVAMPAFEKLLHKLKNNQHGSLRRVDLSDNGLNGDYVPGLIEILRRGPRHLDLSHNYFEGPAMQQLCNALPHVAQYLEVLDLRCNPCSSEPAFIFCVADVVQAMKFLVRLGVTVRTEPGLGEPGQVMQAPAVDTLRSARRRSPSPGRSGSGSASNAAKRGHSAGPGPRGGGARGGGGYPVRSVSSAGTRPNAPSFLTAAAAAGAAPGGASRRVSEAPDASAVTLRGGRDSAVALFRSLAQCHQLRSLDLRSSLLGAAAARRLAHLVRGDRLVTLSLADCFLGDAAEPVLEAVASCRSLVYLNLRLNALTGHAAKVLALALDESVSLTEVDLASNELGDDFGEAFARRVLRHNEVLWKVDLARNALGPRTGKALREALRHWNSSLVDIGDTVEGFAGLGMDNRYHIQCMLEANRGLLEASAEGLAGGGSRSMNPGFDGIELRILKDDPQAFEPLYLF